MCKELLYLQTLWDSQLHFWSYMHDFFPSVFKKDVYSSTTILLHIVITQPNYIIICLYTNYTIKNHYGNYVNVYESIKIFLNPLRQLTNKNPLRGSKQTCQIHGMIPPWVL